MWQNPHDAYLESRVYSAGPTELVCLLYQAAMKAVRNARRHLSSGDITARTRSISAACDILIELAASLDHARGGELSGRLAQLYGYMTRKLIEAHFRQSDMLLAEVLGLLTTLDEGWEELKQQDRSRPAARNESSPWTPPMAREASAEYTSQAWSF